MADELPTERRSEAERTGIMIGITVAVLIALAVFFYWRGTGARDARGHHPPKPPAEALPR